MTDSARETAFERLEHHCELAAWEARDEAYGRMIDAAAAKDDVAYERARRDFWRIGR